MMQNLFRITLLAPELEEVFMFSVLHLNQIGSFSAINRNPGEWAAYRHDIFLLAALHQDYPNSSVGSSDPSVLPQHNA